MTLALPSSPHWAPTTTVTGTCRNPTGRATSARVPDASAPYCSLLGQVERELVIADVHDDRVAVTGAAFEDQRGEAITDLALDHALERPCAECRVIAVTSELGHRRVRHVQRDPP